MTRRAKPAAPAAPAAPAQPAPTAKRHRAQLGAKPQADVPGAKPVKKRRRRMASMRLQGKLAELRARREATTPQAPSAQTPFNLELAKPLPGVVPEAQRVAMDDVFASLYTNMSNGDGFANGGVFFLGFPYLAQLAQRSEYRQLSEIIAEEMTRKWIRVTGPGNQDKQAKVKEMTEALERFKVRDLFRKLTEKEGYFGRIHLFIDVDDGQASDDELKTLLILDPSKINKNTKLAFRIVEPMWTYPSMYNASNPLHRDFYRPPFWYVMGKQVHRSRLLTMITRDVPDVLKPAYSFAGLSLSQLAKPYIDNWLRTRQSVSDLVHSFAINILQTNMTGVLTDEEDDGSDLFDRMDLFNATRDNNGLFAIDKTEEDLKQVTTPLGTLDHLQAQTQEHIAGVGRSPLVKLLGVTPSGLNASSDGEIRVFYDTISAKQEKDYTDLLHTVFQVIQLVIFGEIDPDLGWQFEALWQMDEQAKAAVRKSNADTAAVYIASGVIDAEEERQRIANEDGTLYANLDLNKEIDPPDDDLDEVDEEEGEAALKGAAKPQASGGKKEQTKAQDELPAQDAAPRPTYVHRPLVNVEELEAWAAEHAIPLADDLHVTVAYSRAPLAWVEPLDDQLLVFNEGARSITELGDMLVLEFTSPALSERHADLGRLGASWDWPTYRCHVSLCAKGVAPDTVPSVYQGPLAFGPEVWAALADPKPAMRELVGFGKARATADAAA